MGAIALGLCLIACPPEGHLGDRAAGAPCPEGFACATDVPGGLLFSGPSLASPGLSLDFESDRLPAVALGGTITVTVSGERVVPALTDGCSCGADTRHDTIAPVGGFRPVSGDDTLSVVSTSPPAAILRGVEPGQGTLRIFEQDEDVLIDQTRVSVAAVQRMAIVPYLLDLPEGSIGVWPGAVATFAVQLWGGAEQRMVDEGITCTAAGAMTDKPGWDSCRVTAPEVGALSLRALTSGGVSSALELPVISSVSAVEVTFAYPTVDGLQDTVVAVPRSGALRLACFGARSGDTWVLWAPWTFEVSANLTIVGEWDGCVELRATAPGDGWVRAGVGGVSVELRSHTAE